MVPSLKITELFGFYRRLLADPELLDEAIPFRCDSTEEYGIAIPVGYRRRSGFGTCATEALALNLLAELKKRPADFPNPHLRINVDDLWEVFWGDDIEDIRALVEELGDEAHRRIGRAFGYREDRILTMYPFASP
jgi:hypothetical protein